MTAPLTHSNHTFRNYWNVTCDLVKNGTNVKNRIIGFAFAIIAFSGWVAVMRTDPSFLLQNLITDPGKFVLVVGANYLIFSSVCRFLPVPFFIYTLVKNLPPPTPPPPPLPFPLET